PNMTRGFFRRFYPIGQQRAAFTVTRGRKISAARALRAGRSLSFTQSGEIVRFDVPSVSDYEVIALTGFGGAPLTAVGFSRRRFSLPGPPPPDRGAPARPNPR